jgi:hypothetical protein
MHRDLRAADHKDGVQMTYSIAMPTISNLNNIGK